MSHQLGFRVPTTIGLRKPPAGSPCSQLTPLAPRAFLGPWSELGASWSEPNVILGHWVPGTFLEPQEAPSLLPLLPACSPCSQRIPGSLEPLGDKGLWAKWEQAEAGSPPSQLTPLTPAHSHLSPASQLAPAHSSLLPAVSSLPAHFSLLPVLSSLPAHSSLLQLTPVAPASSQLAPSSLQPPSSLQLAPAHSSSLQLTPAHS